jgi:hypothetical protein
MRRGFATAQSGAEGRGDEIPNWQTGISSL